MTSYLISGDIFLHRRRSDRIAFRGVARALLSPRGEERKPNRIEHIVMGGGAHTEPRAAVRLGVARRKKRFKKINIRYWALSCTRLLSFALGIAFAGRCRAVAELSKGRRERLSLKQHSGD